MRRLLALSVILGAVACKERQPATSGTEAAGPGQRKVLGAGADYAADPRPTETIKAELLGSFAKRRAFGWSVVERVLRPVDLSAATQAAAAGATLPKVPAVMTWYTAEEAQKIFEVYYRSLRAARAAGQNPEPNTLAKQAVQTYSAQEKLAGAPEGLFAKLAAELAAGGDGAAATAAGLGKGNQMVPNVSLFNTSAVVHYLTHYDQVGKCLAQYQTTQPTLNDTTLTADVFGGCFGKDQPFPVDAVAVKTAWRVLYQNPRLRTVATDADGLLAAVNAGDGGWKDAPGTDAPLPPGGIYTVRVATGGSTHDYALTGMHITTKEVPEWVFVSLWWNDQPDGDFGADRPASLCVDPNDEACPETDAFLAPFRHYKMCIATHWDERDPVFQGPVPADDPLAPVLRPLKAFYDKSGGHTWCSNQYIESGAHEVGSNCIGCHQFAAPGVPFTRSTPGGSVLNVLDKRANNFLADFMWSFANGDEVGNMVNDKRQDLDAELGAPGQ